MTQTASGTSKIERDMADHLALVKTLAHHDAAISGLGTRMTGVETGLNHVNDKVSSLDNRVAQGFGEVLSQIRESKASQGPGLGDSIKMAVGSVSLVAAAVVVVTFLVTSYVDPKLEKINSKAETLMGLRQRDENERAREYERLREGRHERVDGEIERLTEELDAVQAKAGWGNVVIDRGARK
jgi:hypothetical protein